MDRRVEELLTRGVEALEKLAQDEIELKLETKPPVCPHCATMNPNIRVEVNGEGSFAEFFIPAHCLHCNNVFYIFPFQWEVLKSVEEVREFTEEKVNLGGFTKNGGND
jgi:RNase P subunit RPR2